MVLFPLSIPVLWRVKFVHIKDATRFILNANGTDGEVSIHSVPRSQVGSTTVYGGCLCAVGMSDRLLMGSLQISSAREFMQTRHQQGFVYEEERILTDSTSSRSEFKDVVNNYAYTMKKYI